MMQEDVYSETTILILISLRLSLQNSGLLSSMKFHLIYKGFLVFYVFKICLESAKGYNSAVKLLRFRPFDVLISRTLYLYLSISLPLSL